jgi:hypothetical protein
MKKLFQTLKIITLALVLTVGINWASATYTSRPSVAPTGGNTPAPLNIGSSAQARLGALALGTTNMPASGAALDVYGSVIADSIASFANTVVTGNVTANSLTLPGLSGAGNQSLCVTGSGDVVACGSATGLPSLKTATITNSGCSGDCSFVTGSGGSYTFNAASVYLFKVEAIGGGGGGAKGSNGSAGGATTFSGSGVSLTATGGAGGTNTTTAASGGSGSGGDVNASGVAGAVGGTNVAATASISGPIRYGGYATAGSGGAAGGSGGAGGYRGSGDYWFISTTGGGPGPTGFLYNLKDFFSVKNAYAMPTSPYDCPTETNDPTHANYVTYDSGSSGSSMGGGGGGSGWHYCKGDTRNPEYYGNVPARSGGGGGGGGYAAKFVTIPSSVSSRNYVMSIGAGGAGSSTPHISGSVAGGNAGSGAGGGVIITYQQ